MHVHVGITAQWWGTAVAITAPNTGCAGNILCVWPVVTGTEHALSTTNATAGVGSTILCTWPVVTGTEHARHALCLHMVRMVLSFCFYHLRKSFAADPLSGPSYRIVCHPHTVVCGCIVLCCLFIAIDVLFGGSYSKIVGGPHADHGEPLAAPLWFHMFKHNQPHLADMFAHSVSGRQYNELFLIGTAGPERTYARSECYMAQAVHVTHALS